MAECIEREALITKFKKMELGEHGLVERLFADGVYAVIAAFPAADVAPVVRCEGCKHRIYKYVNSWIGEIGGCNIFNHPMPNDAFCSYGERKDGGDG